MHSVYRLTFIQLSVHLFLWVTKTVRADAAMYVSE